MWTLGLKRFTCSVLCTLLWILHPIVEKWTFKFWAHFTVKSSSLNTLGNMSLQNVAVTNHSLCTGRTTSLSNTSWWQEKKKEKNIAVTNRFVYTGKFCLRDQIFSLHKYEILCDLLQRQKFCRGDNDFHTNSPVRNDLSLKDVAATYRLVWSDL